MKRLFCLFSASDRDGLGHARRVESIVQQLIRKRENLSIRLVNLVQDRTYLPAGRTQFTSIEPEIESFEICDFSDVNIDPTADILIVDLPQTEYLDLNKKIAMFNGKIIMIDDLTSRRILSTVNVYPPIPQIEKLSWDGFEGNNRIGFEYYPLHADIDKYRQPSAVTLRATAIFGGSDPNNLTGKLCQVAKLIPKLEFDLIKGGLATNAVSIPGNVYVHEEVVSTGVFSIASKNAFAIAAFGVTVYELHRLGVPTIVIATEEDHVESFEAFANNKDFRLLKASVSVEQLEDVIREYKERFSNYIRLNEAFSTQVVWEDI